MTHRILIVDDDLEFNALIGDVFAQAGYVVETTVDAEAALSILEGERFDLVVTDFRMPGPSGLELIERIRSDHSDLPIIMVSGFLENGIIRELIRLGVGGVFMKPLNIFSLLKKAEALIERLEAREADFGDKLSGGFGANVGYPFQAFPCRDQVTRDFARRLYDYRNFNKCLLLIAEPGTDTRTICEDLIAASDQCRQFVACPAKNLTEALMTEILEGDEAREFDGVTFVFERTSDLSVAQQRSIASMVRSRRDPGSVPRRFIFILDRILDDYYDEGIISEEFYLFLGTSEIKVPRLSDLQEDLPLIAETIFSREFPGKELQGAALAFLQRHEWAGGMAGFCACLRDAARLSAQPEISVEVLRIACDGGKGRTAVGGENTVEADDDLSPLEAHLRGRRSDYLEAFKCLVGPTVLSPSETTV